MTPRIDARLFVLTNNSLLLGLGLGLFALQRSGVQIAGGLLVAILVLWNRLGAGRLKPA